MKPQTIEEKVEWYAMLHKQNLNGRETEDELFEAGILAGIEETEEIMYSDEEVIDSIQYTINNFFNGKLAGLNSKEIFEQFKKEKGLCD